MDYLGVREFHLRPHRCSVDENLWAREIESGFLEDPEQDLPVEDVFTWTRNLLDTPDEPATVSLTFNDGLPVAVDGDRLLLSEVITRLNFLGGQHGVGRYDGLEDSLFGLKIHETREAPAAQILLTAHRELETAVLDSHTLGVKAVLDAEWVSLAVEGYWYSPLREGLDLAIARLNQGLQGEIRVRLHKGHVIVLSRQAEAGLYHRRIGPAYDSLTSRMPYGVYYGLLGLRYRPPG